MRNRRATRGRRNVKEVLSDRRFYIISSILIGIIIFSILGISYQKHMEKQRVAKQKEEIENYRLEIFRSMGIAEAGEGNVQEEEAEEGNDSEGENEDGENKEPENVAPKYSRIKLSIVGDILCNTDLLNDGKNDDGYYYDNMFSEVAHYTQEADYAVGTLETNFAEGDYSGVTKYNTPIEFLNAIKQTGIDLVSVAHNHILDYGESGFNSTIEKVQDASFSITGIKNNKENKNKDFTGNIKEVKGIKIAFLAYTYGLSNERELSDEEKEIANIYSPELVDKDFAYAKENANFIIVIMHWGEVNNSYITDWQKDVRDYLVEKGADVILGSHPSVVEPIELIKDDNKRDILIAYSLGNYISSYKYENADVEMILNIEVSKGSDEDKALLSSAEYIPVYVLDNGPKSVNRFELKDMKALALAYEVDSDDSISKKVYDRVVSKLKWLNDLMIKD